MRIGIWLGNEILPTLGGGGAYVQRIINLIDNYNFDKDIDICYLTLSPQKNLQRKVINVSQLPRALFRIFHFSKFLFSFIERIDNYIIRKRGLAKILKGENIKIVCYIRQGDCIDSEFPFIFNNWDIGHRSTHSFPELTIKGIFEQRDEFYQKILPKSLLTICESESGKKELMYYTRMGSHKIRVMPLFAGGVSTLEYQEEEINKTLIDVGVKSNMFFYYPAQFWAHKNHVGLIKAFKEFGEKYRDYKLVLSGSDKGNKEYVKSVVAKLGIEDKVIILGFVSNETVYSLYKKATALVMASHFGPTNMPPIEAMELGCPVICSDLSGHREILGDNAVYFNSYNSDSILKALTELTENRDEWKKRIKKQKDITVFNEKNALRSFNNILLDAINIRENWG